MDRKVITNLKKARTLIDTIIEMLEKEEYCINVMQQNLAAIGLLKSANQTLMENHLKTCFSQAIHSENEKKKDDMIEEILTVTKLLNR